MSKHAQKRDERKTEKTEKAHRRLTEQLLKLKCRMA